MAPISAAKNAPLLLFALAGMLACASVEVTPPDERFAEKSRTYDLAYDEAWARAVDWFADHNVLIDKVEKDSGLLTARLTTQVGEQFLDCGDIQVSGVMGPGEIKRSGSLKVTVRTPAPDRSKVNVNFFGEWSLRDKDSWDGRKVTSHGHCVSTGVLERSVLDSIGE